MGTGKNHSIMEIAEMIGGKRDIVPSRSAEVKETLADIESTMRDLGWFPKFKLEDMLNSY